MATELDPRSRTCLRWRGRRPSWRRADEGGFDARRYEVAAVAEVPARRFVEEHHYSGSYPAARLRYGMYEREQLVGVAVLSVPVRRAVLEAPFPDLEPYAESLELGRFVLLDRVPANAESWFLARAFELARRAGVRGVVSFADPVVRTRADGGVAFAGHRGTIYLASNALWAGRSTARSLLLLPDGRVLNERRVQKIRRDEEGHEWAERYLREYGAPMRRDNEDGASYLKRASLAIGIRKLRHGGCHRFLFPLGSAREKRLVALGLPTGAYPKED